MVSEGWDTSGESVIMNRFPGLGCQELVSVDHMEALGRSDVAEKLQPVVDWKLSESRV